MPVSVLVSAVSKLYGSFAALRQVTATFEYGKCYVILGENGAGKSTLLRLIAGLTGPSLGTLTVFDQAPQEVRGRIGFLSHASMLYDELTALENIQYFARLHPAASQMSAESALLTVGLDPALKRSVGQYSQGMRQRASLARMLLSQPELLLLDEPFANLDAASSEAMLRLLDGLRGQNRTILLTTHQPELARPLADVFVQMQAGQIVAFSPRLESTMATTRGPQ